MKLLVMFGLVALVLMLTPDCARAIPRFSAQTGFRCQSCHVNPAGGGMRNPNGAKFGREDLAVQEWSEEAGIEDLSKILPSFLGVGADFRTMLLVRQSPDSAGSGSRYDNEFWQMQGDLYFNFRIAKKINLYFKKGLYSGFEAYGLLNVLPWRGHVKVGKFVPNYGMRLDDHTAFIRTATGLSPAGGRAEVTGVEAALVPGPVLVGAGIYNAADGFGGTAGSDKAYLGRLEGVFTVANDVHVGIGGNILHRENGPGSTTFFGGFASFGIAGLTVIGEGDLLRHTLPAGTTTGLVVFGEADYVIIDGVDVQVSYDFYDADKDHKSGSTSRYSIGIGFMPLGGVEVRPVYRIIQEDPNDVKNNELHVQFHIYL